MSSNPTPTVNRTGRLISSQNKSLYQIILAFDGSKHAYAAMEILLDLDATNTEITTLSVIPTQQLSGYEDLQNKSEQVTKKLISRGFKVNSEFKAGNPAATINDYATEHDADLIVIGAKGLRSTMGILLGGVAQQVVEYSSCPVLIMRYPYTGLSRVLLVTDGSPSSQTALEYLSLQCNEVYPKINRSKKRCFWLPKNIEVSVMHVLPPSVPADIASQVWTIYPESIYLSPQPEIDRDEIEAIEEKEGNRLLSEALGTLEKANIQAKKVLCRGDAATEIIEYVEQKEIDLIVCGSRGLSQVTGWLLGSVSRKLVHYSNCSVLVVK